MSDISLLSLTASAAAIRQALWPHLPEGAALACGPIDAWRGRLFPSEAASVEAAVPARRAEFQAGRLASRAALAELGHPPRPIRAAADRSPIWPSGLVGAITHAGGLCAALVASAEAYAGLGLDLEPDCPLDPDLVDLVIRPDERQAASQDVATEGSSIDRAKLIFVIKEAVYKAQYPGTRRRLDFQDVTVVIDPNRGGFTASLPISEHGSRFSRIAGHWIAAGGFLAALAAVGRTNEACRFPVRVVSDV